MGVRMRAPWLVLTVALLVIPPTAAWLAWGSGDSRDQGPVLAGPRYPGPGPEQLVRPAGQVLVDREVPIERLEQLNLFGVEEIGLLGETGIVGSRVRLSRENGVNLLLGRFTAGEDGDPGNARDRLDGFYADGGHKEIEPAPRGVKVRRFTDQDSGATVSYHAHYVKGRDLVRVDATVFDGAAGPVPIDRLFGDLLAEQTTAFPADE